MPNRKDGLAKKGARERKILQYWNGDISRVYTKRNRKTEVQDMRRK